MNTIVHWHAIYTRRNCEKKVCSLLEKKGIIYYCPQNKTRSAGSIQHKFTITPLFPSIIFITANQNTSIQSLAQLPQVINILYWKQHPAVFPAEEIESLRQFVEVHETVAVIKTGLHNSINDLLPASATSTITLPSIGYALSAIAEPVTKVTLVRNNSGRYNAAEGLALILGLKNRIE